MKTVAIVGVGLIGGSFALALRKAGFSGTIVGVSSPAAIAAAEVRGVIDSGVTLQEAAATADLIYLSQPIHGILSTINHLGPLVRQDCLVTDAGSTKSEIVSNARNLFTLGNFLGGHPMAGKELSGVQHADADLFRGRTYVLTPEHPQDLDTPVTRGFRNWLDRIGANVLVLTPSEHDRVVAFTSHLPQLLSTALAATVSEQIDGDSNHLQVSGSGLRDSTRLALSSFEIWHDILTSNTTEIDHALHLYIDKLQRIRQNLTNLQLREEFTVAAQVARRLRD